MDIAELAQRILDRHRARVLSRAEERAEHADPAEVPLPIVQAGHPALRRRGQDVLEDQSLITRDASHEELLAALRLPLPLLQELVQIMTLTMHKAPGVGLAAPQIGLPLRMAVLEDRYAREVEDAEGAVQPHTQTEEDLAHLGSEEEQLERRPLPLRTLLDPVYEITGSLDVFAFEGCLSVDGWQSIVPRSRTVRVRAVELTAEGRLRTIDEQHTGWTARIHQHEIDHLAGILCHDRAVPRSFVEGRWAMRYDVHEAISRLGLEGDIQHLRPGRVILSRT